MWKKVLFLHDFSDDTAAGLSWAAHVLLPRNSTLLLVHIVNPILGSETPEKVRLAREELEHIADDLTSIITVETVVTTGEPLEELPRIARSEGCSSAILLVDDPDEAALIVPSLALPQLLFRKGSPYREEERLFRAVTVALDLSPERTDSLIASLRKNLSAEITSLELVHSLPLENPESAPELLLSADAALKELQEELAASFPDVRSTLLTGTPEETLPLHLIQSKASLFVLGLSRHSDLWEIFLGGTAQRLLQQVTLPVLLLPV